ncbi:GDSL-type esterase/lipase family protein [Brevundimonas sp. SL130]|uniref:GDSL-type esterase/lipase family protein n=1 Tax=Brevundimonas sp. SL130 TaxID=2995143 RepID=UPI00226C9BCC|nr:GDSL-type esterase/lipase family protein [Brevundimonas sp. SL130]WAC61462.1 GDSL-type esterase/lipase family protein [Brevundimonas sp. SL130]
MNYFIVAFLSILATLVTGPAWAQQTAPQQHWARSWYAAPLAATADRMPPSLKNATIRQTIRISLGGERFRLRLSNEFGDTPMRLGRATVFLMGDDGRPVAGSERDVVFDGRPDALLPAGAPILSDPVDLHLPALSRLTVSLYLPEDAPQPTIHLLGLATSWVSPGDQTSAAELTDAVSTTQRILLSGVDVERPRPGRIVVALGDSITDGANGTRNADRRWPDLLAGRLQAAGLTEVAVANAGISGNRILNPRPGLGVAALARFDRDVLAVPGVTDVIILEGVNDIGMAWRDKDPHPPTAADLIAGYRQMITRAHARGLRVFLATILPYEGANYWSEPGEAVRQAVNTWIRSGGEADGVIDFDAVMRDRENPGHLASVYDSGDRLHPNDAGFKAMADAIDLTLFR